MASLGSGEHLLLRNHGCLTVGANIADAFLNMYVLVSACKAQVLIMSIPGQKVSTTGETLYSPPQHCITPCDLEPFRSLAALCQVTVRPEIIERARRVAVAATHADKSGGSMGMIAWPAMTRRVNRELPGYDQ